MNIKTKITKLEKTRLKLFKQIIELEKKMDKCSLKELSIIQFKFAKTYTKLLKIEEIIKEIYPNITNEFNYINRINYKKF